jgi:hypothetical protein
MEFLLISFGNEPNDGGQCQLNKASGVATCIILKSIKNRMYEKVFNSHCYFIVHTNVS